MTIVKICFCLTVSLSFVTAQQTRPERTKYEETSRYQDVIDFIEALQPDGKTIKVDWLGYSTFGKRLPMIVVGDIADTRPATIRRSGKVVVYVQGNIHGGEVEGKEAMLELLREIKEGQHADWRRRLIVIIVPIFNADGNDIITLHNRPWQHGPVAGMGQRANGQGLDLNRDHIKLESPEVRAFVRMMNDYDPHITVDLHTTNGSFHGYHITYGFAINPNIDPALDRYTRAEFFPAVEQRMRSKKWRIHRYGDYLEKTPAGKPGYYYWAHETRYNTDYVGSRNRIAILSEAYSYITFKQRIAATKAFVVNILDVANANAAAIKRTIAAADSSAMDLRRFDSLAVRAEIVESDSAQEILLAYANEERNPYSGEKMYLMNEDSIRPIVTAEFYATAATKKAKVPRYYVVPDSLTAVLRLLRDHGIVIDTVKETSSMHARRFTITKNTQSDREFQKHRMRTLEGEYKIVTNTVSPGSFLIRTDQPLSRLVFSLLEPESEDGIVAWNFIDRYFGDGKYYPILTSID
jgi:predicted deacylase